MRCASAPSPRSDSVMPLHPRRGEIGALHRPRRPFPAAARRDPRQHPVADPLWPACVLGTASLGLSKIFAEHGTGPQRDARPVRLMCYPHLEGRSYEWDIVAPATTGARPTISGAPHLHQRARPGRRHRLRPALPLPEQRWKPFYLVQPLVAVVFALLFEWGVAIQDLRLGRWLQGRMSRAQVRAEPPPSRTQVWRATSCATTCCSRCWPGRSSCPVPCWAASSPT